MEFLKITPFNIVTEKNTDYNDTCNIDVRTHFPNKLYLINALDNVHQKYPQYTNNYNALKYAKQLLHEEKSVIAVAIEEVKDHFKLHVKCSKKYEHMDVAYSRVAHGMRNKHSTTLLRKVPPTYKTTEDFLRHGGDVIGNMLSGYITISLVSSIVFGGSLLFNLTVLGAYHGYIKTFVEKYYKKVIVVIKERRERLLNTDASNTSPPKGHDESLPAVSNERVNVSSGKSSPNGTILNNIEEVETSSSEDSSPVEFLQIIGGGPTPSSGIATRERGYTNKSSV